METYQYFANDSQHLCLVLSDQYDDMVNKALDAKMSH